MFTLRSDTTIREAIKALSKHNFSCAPVVDVSKTGALNLKWQDKYLGIVDTVGLVMYMLDFLQGTTDFDKETALVASFDVNTVSDLTTRAFWCPFVALDESSSLFDAMLLLGQYGLHRIPVLAHASEGHDKMTNLITQSALLKLLDRHLHFFHDLTKRSLLDLGLGTPKNVISIDEHKSVLDAFHLIRDQRVSAVPVTNIKGQLVGNVSARDARSLVKDPTMMSMLHGPLIKWLSGDYMETITCSPTDSLEVAMKRLNENGVHRIYLVDDNQHLVRVLSLRDVISRFVKEPTADYCRKFFGTYSQAHFEGIKLKS